MTEDRRPTPAMWVFGILFLFLVVRVVMREMPKPAASAIAWVPVAEARGRAESTGKPILYEFSAEWCGPCRSLEADVFANPAHAARINEAFIPVRLVDRQREEGRNPADVAQLQQRFAVEAFPTVIVTDAAGATKKRLEGYGDASRFMTELEEALR